MFFVAVVLYFLLACFITWQVLFPSGREVVLRTIANIAPRVRHHFCNLDNAKSQAVKSLVYNSRVSTVQAWEFTKHHRLLFFTGITVICLPPLLAWLLSSKTMLSGFEDSTRDENMQIAELLKGEQLVPPQALPPDVFTTQEVMQIRPLLIGASRNWQLLNSSFAQQLLLVFKIMKEKHGYDMAILEGYRSPERQNMLASQGANVTNAKAFQSYHQFGLAADCAFLRDGKLVISEKDPWAMEGYRLYGEVAESLGLHWGGRWKMMDFGHTEFRMAGVIQKQQFISQQ